jgi:shikimate dehydrogenase
VVSAESEGGVVTMAEARGAVGEDVRLVGVIGSPVAHSLSPLLHNTAFAALGLGAAWRSYAFEVPGGEAAGALSSMRSNGLTGLSVTMPHKGDVAKLVDSCSETARRLGAVNCVVVREGGTLFGANTDGEGFVASLARGVGFEPRGSRCVVIGAGGAARAVILALADAGAASVAVVNRTPERAVGAADLARPVGVAVPAGDRAGLEATVAAADLVVNATPVGMTQGPALGAGAAGGGGAGEWLVPPGLLGAGQVAADLVYAPRLTWWLAAARKAGATTLDGLGMLVHQAAAQLVLWTGLEPPLEAMWEAAESASPLG